MVYTGSYWIKSDFASGGFDTADHVLLLMIHLFIVLPTPSIHGSVDCLSELSSSHLNHPSISGECRPYCSPHLKCVSAFMVFWRNVRILLIVMQGWFAAASAPHLPLLHPRRWAGETLWPGGSFRIILGYGETDTDEKQSRSVLGLLSTFHFSCPHPWNASSIRSGQNQVLGQIRKTHFFLRGP